MTEAFTKKDAEEFKKDIKRYMGVLAEDFQHRINLAIDGLTGKIESTEARLSNKIDSVEEKLNNKINSVEEGLSNKIDSLKDELIAHRDNTEVHVQRAKRKSKAS